jgi:hypothetical protein
MDDAFHTGVLIAASIALRPRAAPARCARSPMCGASLRETARPDEGGRETLIPCLGQCRVTRRAARVRSIPEQGVFAVRETPALATIINLLYWCVCLR